MKHDFRIFYNYDPSDPGRYHHHALDADYFDWLMSRLKGTGLTFLFRANLAGRCYYHSRLMSPFDHASIDHTNPQAQYWHKLADTMDGCDPLAEAVRAARRHGVPIWVWWNWNEWHNVRPGFLDLNDRVWYDKPRKYWCSRDGSRFYCGVPDWGDAEVVERLVGLARETLGYGIEGVYLSTRSHSWWACWPSPDWDAHLEPFGFNDSVIHAYRKRYGVDIRYEDYDTEKWLRIKGEQFSTMLARVGAAVHGAGKPFVIGIQPDRYSLMVEFELKGAFRAGGPHLKLYKDWEAWVASGSVDGICAEQACPSKLKLAGADIAPIRQTLPADFPVYTWADTTCYNNRGAGPFSLENWDRHPVEEVLAQIDLAKKQGAAGIFLHSLYHYTSCDSAGHAFAGYGVLPRDEYLDALRQRASA